jgi:hypothetical protein
MLDAQKIIQAMQRHGYRVDSGDDVMNLVYVEGMNLDGSPNGNRPNCWDDIRVLVRNATGGPKVLGAWEATTEPGAYWSAPDHRMNVEGAFHIDLGQQTAWVPGEYHDAPALVQAKPIHGTRDGKVHYARDGKPDFGMFGVHHHKGYDYPKDNIGKSSAGCQVGRTVAGHMEFWNLLKTDKRFSPTFVWTSTVMPAAWVTSAAAPIIVTADNPTGGRPLISSIRHMLGLG